MFRRRLPLYQTGLLRALHKRAGCDCTLEAAEKMVAIEKVALIAAMNPWWSDLASEVLGE